MTLDEARARVAKGVALLDEKRPGWETRIDSGRLSMESDCDCILGQLEGSYTSAIDTFCPGSVAVYRAHSFPSARGLPRWTPDARKIVSPSCAAGFATWDGDYDVLQQAWLEVLSERVPPPVTWTHRTQAEQVRS